MQVFDKISHAFRDDVVETVGRYPYEGEVDKVARDVFHSDGAFAVGSFPSVAELSGGPVQQDSVENAQYGFFHLPRVHSDLQGVRFRVHRSANECRGSILFTKKVVDTGL